jgi:hypothetical protein
MKYSRIFIDISNLYHRAFHVSKHLTTKLPDGSEIVTGGIFTSLKMIRSIERKFLTNFGQIYCIFDNTFSVIDKRKEIDPEYKSNRKEQKDPSFYRGLDYLNTILMNYDDHFVVVKRPGSESDDLVSTLLEENKNLDYLLISNDLDWARSITDNVHWAKYSNKEKDYIIYDDEKFEERYGYSPKNNAVKIYKAFRGDSSDNIAVGVPRIREELLIKLVNEFKNDTIQDIIKSVYSLSYVSDTWKQKILENRSRLDLNYRLVDFQKVSAKELEDFIFTSSFNEKELKFVYKSLGFNLESIDSRLANNNGTNSFFRHRRIERA